MQIKGLVRWGAEHPQQGSQCPQLPLISVGTEMLNTSGDAQRLTGNGFKIAMQNLHLQVLLSPMEE